MNNLIQINKTDSRFFGAKAIDWKIAIPLSREQVIREEAELIQKFNPFIITVFISHHDIQSIATFTSCGYEFIESRLLVEREMDDSNVIFNLFPYEFIEVTEKSQLKKIRELFEHFQFDDRFSIDPKIDKKLGQQRNFYFLEQSLKRKDEYIYMLQNSITHEISGFRSFKISPGYEASLLVSGIIEKPGEDICELINIFELEKLSDMNIRRVKAVISITNTDEINRYIAKYGYTLSGSKIVLRKMVIRE